MKTQQFRILFFIAVAFLAQQKWSFAQETCNYLVWSDEFDIPGAPNPEKWGYDTGGGGWGNNELQTYTDSRSNSVVKDGKLVIKALKNNGAWTSARLITKGKGDWLYGRIEVKAKLPEGTGTWPAIWMLPTDWVYGGWPKSGEIDIMEHVGYDFGKVHGTIHTEAYNHSIGTQLGDVVEVNRVATAFHVYAIDWTENEIIWYVDGDEYFRFENPHKTYREWPFDKRFHLLLNIAIGGNWGGAQGVDPNLKEATMEIDYVKVFKKKVPAPVINGKKNVSPGEELIFSTADVGGVRYKWIFPDDVEVINGAGSSEVAVKWGNSGGDINLQLLSDCDTVAAEPFSVSTVFQPSGEQFEIPFFDDQNNIFWQAVPGNSNQMQLSGTASLIADYNISAPTENPFLRYEFQNPVDLTSFNKLEIKLKTPSPAPGSFRVDLVDTNGNINLNDLFKITSFETDGEFHTYSYEFGQNPDGIYDLSTIKSIRIYVNYGFFGKTGTGQIEIQSVALKNTSTGLNAVLSKKEPAVWPNPFSNFLQIRNYSPITKIEIFDTGGNLVFSKNNLNSNKIELQPAIQPGLYLIKVFNKSGELQSFSILKTVR